MSELRSHVHSSIVAVYADHEAAERMVRQLHEAGISMSDLSIIGRGSQTTEEPVGFVSAGDYAQAGAATGAWFGGLLGLCVGAAFLVLPGIGPIVVAGPLSAAVLAGIEGAPGGDRTGQPGWSARRLGCAARESAQVRNARQGGQVPRRRARRARGDCPRRACLTSTRPPASTASIRQHIELETTGDVRPR